MLGKLALSTIYRAIRFSCELQHHDGREGVIDIITYYYCQGPGYSAEERANELFNMVFANSILGVKQLFII